MISLDSVSFCNESISSVLTLNVFLLNFILVIIIIRMSAKMMSLDSVSFCKVAISSVFILNVFLLNGGAPIKWVDYLCYRDSDSFKLTNPRRKMSTFKVTKMSPTVKLFSISRLSITALTITTFSITTLSITTFSITALGITIKN
jgi:hypothetical protein